MRLRRSISKGVFRISLAIAILLTARLAAAATSYKQAGFSEAVVFSGLTNPTVVRFCRTAACIVAEKSGLIKIFPNLTTNTLHGRRRPAHRGPQLLGPRAARTGGRPELRDRTISSTCSTPTTPPIGGAAPRWGVAGGTSDGCPTPPGRTTDGCVVSGRLSRLTAVGLRLDRRASTSLINDWCQQFPSHSIGSLRLRRRRLPLRQRRRGRELRQRGLGPVRRELRAARPRRRTPAATRRPDRRRRRRRRPAEGGALRAQSPRRAAGEPRLLNGAILRVDPATGAGACRATPLRLGRRQRATHHRVTGCATPSA